MRFDSAIPKLLLRGLYKSMVEVFLSVGLTLELAYCCAIERYGLVRVHLSSLDENYFLCVFSFLFFYRLPKIKCVRMVWVSG